MKSKIDGILEKYRREGRVTTLSQEESNEISSRINYEMKKVGRDYQRREIQSEIEAGKIYFTC